MRAASCCIPAGNGSHAFYQFIFFLVTSPARISFISLPLSAFAITGCSFPSTTLRFFINFSRQLGKLQHICYIKEPQLDPVNAPVYPNESRYCFFHKLQFFVIFPAVFFNLIIKFIGIFRFPVKGLNQNPLPIYFSSVQLPGNSSQIKKNLRAISRAALQGSHL